MRDPASAARLSPPFRRNWMARRFACGCDRRLVSAFALWRFAENLGPLRSLCRATNARPSCSIATGGCCGLRDSGRALAPAGRDRRRRSALSRHAEGLRGRALRPPSRRRSAGARCAPARSSSRHGRVVVRRLDADHAGRAPAGAARGAHARARSCASSCAPCSSSGGCRRTRSSRSTSRSRPTAAISRARAAATLSYFGKEPKRLSFAEAALLVALPQSPETRRPDRFADAARRARDRVLDRARRARRPRPPPEAEAAQGRAGAGGAPAVPDARGPRGGGRCRGSAGREGPSPRDRRPAAGEPGDAGARARARRSGRSSPPPSW